LYDSQSKRVGGVRVSAHGGATKPIYRQPPSFVPYYAQIVDHIRAQVKQGKLKEGQVFCSEGDIARVLGISKMPVRQAFQKLRSEGLLIIAKGKRPVIGSGRVPWNFQQLRGFSEEMRRRGLVPSAKLLALDKVEPALDVAQALKLTPGEQASL
jgi:GntR family transcriptional regulator